MTVHEEYQSIIKQRYGNERSKSYEKRGYYDWVLMAPQQYLVEYPMLSYVKEYPEATLKEVFCYFDRITPDGLAPGDNGEDL